MDMLRKMGVAAMGVRHNGVYTRKTKGKQKVKKTADERKARRALAEQRYKKNAMRVALGKTQGFAMFSGK